MIWQWFINGLRLTNKHSFINGRRLTNKHSFINGRRLTNKHSFINGHRMIIRSRSTAAVSVDNVSR